MIPVFSERKDPLSEYLSPVLKGYLYDCLSEDYCLRSDMKFLVNIPLPFTPSDYVTFQKGGDISLADLADNIIVTMGADSGFKYGARYKRLLAKLFDEKLVGAILSRAGEQLQQKEYPRACIYARACLLLENDDVSAMYLYACSCREWYLSLEGDEEAFEQITALKEEANAFFEYCTEADSSFAPAWYYLGYAYLNQALYAKAQLAWSRFIALNSDEKDEAVTEIKERLQSLKEPVIIESGINHMIAGRIEEGLRILEPYTETEFAGWWPLHFYLACGYRQMGWLTEAIEGFQKVIALSPSHYESYLALAELCAQTGEAELAEKYGRKAELLRHGLEEVVSGGAAV
ncbi:MAG: hypothetical protein HUJ80_05295 [Firmicutes bacterium]|nr:hypothetical protein [Bacillota bacterium]